MFKQLLDDTKKNHATESTIDSKHYDYDNIENVAKAIKKDKRRDRTVWHCCQNEKF